MGEVIELKSRRDKGFTEMMYECSCGSHGFLILSSGHVECLKCEKVPGAITLSIDFDE